jgi:hypothetical protein
MAQQQIDRLARAIVGLRAIRREYLVDVPPHR